MNEIVLAGGCFWGIQKAFSSLRGIISTECGYANGDPRIVPDYRAVCSGKHGFAEAVRIQYDRIRLEDVLSAFFLLIDPTRADGQGNDIGVQYRTGIYWTDGGSAKIVKQVLEEQASRYEEFHTECGPLENWTRAEDYHQDYLDRNPNGYCHIPAWKLELVRDAIDLSGDG